MKLKLPLALLSIVTIPSLAQTTTTAKKSTTTTHRAATSATKPTPAPEANPADNPPNVPKIEGTPKNLYALRYVDITVGTGELAQSRRYYTVHYTGWLTDGTKFDSSYDHPRRGVGSADLAVVRPPEATPFSFPYGAHRVIPGWDTGFEGMRVGGKRRLFIPWQLAYGETGRGPIPPKADLIFDIEFISQSETDPTLAPAAPAPTETKPSTPPNPDTKTPPHPETH